MLNIIVCKFYKQNNTQNDDYVPMVTPSRSAPNIFEYPAKSATLRPPIIPRKPHKLRKSATLDHNTKPCYQEDTPDRPPKVNFCTFFYTTLYIIKRYINN